MTALGVLIFTGIAGLLLWAVLRKPEAITLTLAGFFVGTAPLDFMMPMERLIPILSFLDACMVVAMAAIWTRHHSQRARVIGTIGLTKVAWAMWAVSFNHINYFSYATALNMAFVAQVIVAGGFVDAVGRWVDDLRRRAVHGLVGLRGHVG